VKRIPVQLFHKDPETGSVPLKDFDRSAPAVAKSKHTAEVSSAFSMYLSQTCRVTSFTCSLLCGQLQQ